MDDCILTSETNLVTMDLVTNTTEMQLQLNQEVQVDKLSEKMFHQTLKKKKRFIWASKPLKPLLIHSTYIIIWTRLLGSNLSSTSH